MGPFCPLWPSEIIPPRLTWAIVLKTWLNTIKCYNVLEDIFLEVWAEMLNSRNSLWMFLLFHEDLMAFSCKKTIIMIIRISFGQPYTQNVCIQTNSIYTYIHIYAHTHIFPLPKQTIFKLQFIHRGVLLTQLLLHVLYLANLTADKQNIWGLY